MKTLAILFLVAISISQVLSQMNGLSQLSNGQVPNFGGGATGRMANTLASAYVNSNPALKAGLMGMKALSNARKTGGMNNPMGSMRGAVPMTFRGTGTSSLG